MMIERSSSTILRKTISELHTGILYHFTFVRDAIIGPAIIFTVLPPAMLSCRSLFFLQLHKILLTDGEELDADVCVVGIGK